LVYGRGLRKVLEALQTHTGEDQGKRGQVGAPSGSNSRNPEFSILVAIRLL
jgi:hypothetical protein